MKEVLKREYQLLGKTRLSHIWHMTLDKEDKPLIITDGALNVMPNVKTKMHILKNVIGFSKRIGNNRPKLQSYQLQKKFLIVYKVQWKQKKLQNYQRKKN